MMNFQHLVTFRTVVSEGSMTAAAQKLFLTQPAVSQQIRQLEDNLGVELLVRGVREIKMTPQGQQLNEYALRILSLAQQAELAIQTMGGQVSGPLRVGTLNSIGLHLIGPIFALFLKNNSQVTLRLRYGEGDSVVKMLEKNEIDIAILPESEKEYGLELGEFDSEEVGEDEMWLVGSPKERLEEEIELKGLAEKPFIMLTREYPAFENMLTKEMKRAGLHLKPVFESSNVGTLKRVIEADLGWGFLPAHSVKKQVSTGRLQRVRIKGLDYTMKMMCYLARTHKRPKTLEVFIRALQQQA